MSVSDVRQLEELKNQIDFSVEYAKREKLRYEEKGNNFNFMVEYYDGQLNAFLVVLDAMEKIKNNKYRY